MSEFNLKDLENIRNTEQIMDLLVDEGIIKEEKFIAELKYQKELKALQYELVKLQSHIVENGKRLVVLFEGRDTAGKGGAISRLKMNLNPKIYHVVALSKPTEKEKGQWYFQRYLEHLPTQGEMTFFDRSWYNRAVVEPVFGFCSDEEYHQFMKVVDNVERLIIKDDIVFIKFFLSISKEEQQKRLKDRADNPLKRWKLGALDQQAQEKWDDYSFYIEKMLKKTGKKKTPWVVIETDDKKTARLEVIKYILANFPDFKTDINTSPNTEVVKIYD